MYLTRTLRSLMRLGRRIAVPALRQVVLVAVGIAAIGILPWEVSVADEPAAATVENSVLEPLVAPYPMRVALAPRRPKHRGHRVSAQAPQAKPEIMHGTDVGPDTVGLRGAGVDPGDLKAVRGGKASDLANEKDSETGRPMLTLLDITGQLTIDVPCVIDRCRVTQSGGLYAVRNSDALDFEARDCEFDAVPNINGKVASAVILHPRTLRRCIVKGGEDGLKLASRDGCLIEETWIYGQIVVDGSHNDAVQSVKGEGDWDTWVFRRCRVEGPWRRQTSALLMQADIGNLSGVTIQDCLLSGGTYTLYTRKKAGYEISKIRVTGTIFVADSWKYGPYSNDCREVEWKENWFAPATSEGSPISVSRENARPFMR